MTVPSQETANQAPLSKYGADGLKNRGIALTDPSGQLKLNGKTYAVN